MSTTPRVLRCALRLLIPALVGGVLSGCSSAQDGTTPDGAVGGGGKPPVINESGSSVKTAPNPALSAEAARLATELEDLSALKADDIASRSSTSFVPAPGYDLENVAGLDAIQGSSLALDTRSLRELGERGFVITEDHPFPTFAYGYATIYLEDLPVYISADSILNAVHRSYESILESLEDRVLSKELDQLLAGMHQKLAQSPPAAVDAKALADADLYLAVARSLLVGSVVAPVAGGSGSEVSKLFDLAQKAEGTTTIELFGVRREDEDFSQFKPRSHYTDSEQLSRYFRAMIWLGRTDLRLLETQSDGTQLFRRRQLQIALLLRDLIGTENRPHYDRVDRTISAFVGEPDYMVLPELDSLIADLNITSSAQIADFSDEQLAQAIIDGDYGRQLISSHVMVNGTGQGTLPLSRSFALLGQRYVLDSHVFSNVVFDRINGDTSHPRMMPSPLDAAFAALGNDQAAALLSPELHDYESTGYPGALAQMRLLSDEHPATYWDGSLYTLWLKALRQLSPSATSSASDAQTLFPVAKSEAWGRRLLTTQLASWAELRHDTILYAKQSYTGGASCDFPDGYVDPYPAFFSALSRYATRGAELIESLGGVTGELSQPLRDHFAFLAEVSDQLGAIAEHERSGAALTPQMLDFINDAVVIQNVCGGGSLESGWYKKLFNHFGDALEVSPTIADVHTQPTDAAGSPVGRVLHVGTGLPRLMVVIAEGCSGPRAYAGMASSYREKVTENYERLDDESWAAMVHGEPEVPWMKDLVTPASQP